MLNFLNIIPEFILDAFKDSIVLIPILFIIFVFIEIFEYYFSDKIDSFLKVSRGIGPIIGTFAAIVPQCGFSVIASSLYIKKFISAGTLLSVYIATSDEAIPILLASPNQTDSVVKIILIKCIIALIVGYTTDFILEKIFHKKQDIATVDAEISNTEKGCCGHHLENGQKIEFITHPLKHTAIIFGFIFIVSVILNYLFTHFGLENIQTYMFQNSILQPIIVGLLGLIPNCAVSVIITQMFIKNIISLGSAIAGLSSAAGLGLLILITKNTNIKNTVFIILTLFSVSVISGILIQLFL